MALIIEGIIMPKRCWRCDFNREARKDIEGKCAFGVSCSLDSEISFIPEPLAQAGRHSNCPIKGEIPDKHGALKDANTFKELTKNTEIRNSRGEIYPIGEAIAKMIDEAPTVAESTE